MGLVLDQIIFRHRGQVSTDEVFIQFVEAVARARFDGIDFCSRVRPHDGDAPYILDPDFYRVIPLPWYRNIARLCLLGPVLLPKAARRLAPVLSGWSLAVAAGLHPITPLVLHMARKRGVPSALWIRGDLATDLRYRLSGPALLAALATVRTLTAALPRGVPVISVGRDDYPFLRRLGPVHVSYSSKFDVGDFRALPAEPTSGPATGRILYVGRLAPEKGLDVLLAALRRIQGQRPNARLTIVGSDYHGSSFGERLHARVAASDLAGSVEMVGHIPYGPDLFACYDGHDVLALPSFTEGFPQVVLEAMIRGLPVVATGVGGVPRLVRDGVSGRIVPPRNPGALAAALADLLDRPEEAHRLARAGQETARAYTRSAQVSGVLEFLSRCYPEARFAAAAD